MMGLHRIYIYIYIFHNTSSDRCPGRPDLPGSTPSRTGRSARSGWKRTARVAAPLPTLPAYVRIPSRQCREAWRARRMRRHTRRAVQGPAWLDLKLGHGVAQLRPSIARGKARPGIPARPQGATRRTHGPSNR